MEESRSQHEVIGVDDRHVVVLKLATTRSLWLELTESADLATTNSSFEGWFCDSHWTWQGSLREKMSCFIRASTNANHNVRVICSKVSYGKSMITCTRMMPAPTVALPPPPPLHGPKPQAMPCHANAQSPLWFVIGSDAQLSPVLGLLRHRGPYSSDNYMIHPQQTIVLSTFLLLQRARLDYSQITMAPRTSAMKVHFEQYNPNSEKGTDTRASLAALDYSPLPRLTWRSFLMGVLVSMGGLM